MLAFKFDMFGSGRQLDTAFGAGAQPQTAFACNLAQYAFPTHC